MGQYYHLFANGDDARDFITSIEDFKTAFNRVALCAFKNPKAKVLAFSIEDSHPHFLMSGSYEDCLRFKRDYEEFTFHYIVSSRGGKDNVVFELEIIEVNDEDYLLNVAAYVIVQPTKDGKPIMPYDYYWGTASMYFRPKGYPQIWLFDTSWKTTSPIAYGDLTFRDKRAMTHSMVELPASWMVANGLILPSNYVDVEMYENIFRTHNRFRVFMSGGRKQLQLVADKMAEVRGITMSDIEARQVARSTSDRLFGKKDARWLNPQQRLMLAKELRYNYHITIRQIATLSRLPESEIRKYMR